MPPPGGPAPGGAHYEFTHDHEPRLTHALNPQGLAWNYRNNSAALMSEQDFDKRTVTHGSDAAGRLIARTDALRHTIRHERDELDRIISKDAHSKVTTFTYDIFEREPARPRDGLHPARLTGPPRANAIPCVETPPRPRQQFGHAPFPTRPPHPGPEGGSPPSAVPACGPATGIQAAARPRQPRGVTAIYQRSYLPAHSTTHSQSTGMCIPMSATPQETISR